MQQRISALRTAATAAVAIMMFAEPAAQVRAQDTQTAQQQVPDAPRPQTLPQVPTLAPDVSNIAPAPGASAAAAGVRDPNAPPSSLSSAQTAKPDADAPQVPANAQEAEKLFTLGAVNVQFVEVPFTVKDSKNQLVPGLTYRDVRIYENGLLQHQAYFTVDPFPLAVALVIDQSVTEDTMERVNNALGAIQGAFTPYDEIAVFTYNNGVKLQDQGQTAGIDPGFDAAQSARLNVILERSKTTGREPIMGLGGPLSQGMVKNNQTIPGANVGSLGGPAMTTNPPKEFHTLNDAIFAAAQQTTKAGKGRKRIVYVISDGKEYGSQVKQSEVIKYCQKYNVQVYATLVGDSSIPGLGFFDRVHLPYTMRDDVLPKYAAATGGQVDPEFRQRGIEQSFAKITEEVRTQYTIGYYSHEPAIDGKYRTIDVRVDRPGLSIIAKPGYYPTPESNGPAPASTAAPTLP